MSQRQIEELIREKNGHLCARRVYRADGSLKTMDSAPRSLLKKVPVSV